MITLDPENNYRPVYSWNFIIIVFIFYTSFITVPTLITSLKIYSVIEKSFLKKRFKKFLIGIAAIIISFYGVSFFNAFKNQNIRLIWSIGTFLIFIGSSILFYRTFGKEV
jgi:hypothetical protein